MELVVLSSELESAFADFYHDFIKHDPENADFYARGTENFADYVRQLQDEEEGINLPDGYVPCSHLWLVENAVILGAIRIRHHIENDFLSLEGGHIGYDVAPSARGRGNGKVMLKLALSKACELGIRKALITADEDNIASRKVIESNGGIFESVVMGKVFPEPIARYWVSCEL
ncbi:GNAT family N-acetyltransferase [Photobacterium galatheae]|uniref:Acetyltransferase n=1 Tax=Photobacterium galatheae TaxID=1654360 RepID=A0A066RW82_9GAMM|nr:GNAT family N-acetyltransferase [Photobacterium galatheae]KDM91633.1 acetyltransferase [Photobacterium galatheae]MCM0149707.1 GNAT family N-acetyltransferase [Photobacterium galatheae]